MEILADATRANDYYLTHEDAKSFADHSWEKGTYMTGLMELYRTTKNKTLLDYAFAWGNAGDWKLVDKKHTTGVEGPKPIKPKGADDADNEICASTYAELYAYDANATYLKDAIRVLGNQINGTKTNYWSWIDAIHMGMNAYSRVGHATGDDRFFETMFKFYNITANAGTPPDGINTFHMWNASESLFYRDDRFLETGTFWGRGNGWAITALARSLQLLPKKPAFDPDRQEYSGKLVAMAHKLKEIQGNDGCWRASLLNESEYPAPETTGSANFAFGIAFGINSGLLAKADFLQVIEKAWTCLSKTALQADGLFGYCQPVGGSPASTSATDTSDFCVGQFLLAATQIAKLAPA
jgi:rhamnogalacturonyl hydrolase YesR